MTSSDPLAGPPRPDLPFAPLPAVAPETRRAIEAAALAANERYLRTFIEQHSFCPFSRGGRAQGLTARYVHYVDSLDIEPFFALMARAAADPGKAVIQVILPMVDVPPEEWIRFCHEVTAAGHVRLAGGARNAPGVFAVAPLHPTLEYNTQNPFAIIPLFRRAPDPTIQWVRLDALEALYRGRTGDTVFVDPDDIEAFLERTHRPPLFDRIAETNLKMARRLGIPEVERTLREIARAARARYTAILLGYDAQYTAAQAGGARPADPFAPSLAAARGAGFSEGETADSTAPFAPSEVEGRMGVDGHSAFDFAQAERVLSSEVGGQISAAAERAAAARSPVVVERDGRVGLMALGDLPLQSPRRFLAEGVDLVLIRARDAVHVLHGRCPHRAASLSDAIVEDDRIVCPHHGWDFRLDSGRSEGVPGESLHRFRSEVHEGLVWVEAAELRRWRSQHVQAFRDDDVIL